MFILYKTKNKQMVRNTITKSIRKILSTPKEVDNVLDLGLLGVKKDGAEQISSIPIKRKKGIKI